MVADWTEVNLKSLGKITTGKTPSTQKEGYFGGEVPFITPSDMDGRRSISTTARRLTNAGVEAVSGARIPAGAVLVSCIGSDMGKAALAAKASATNQQINSVVVEPPNSSLFVYYNLSTRKAEIRGAAGGSAQPIMNKSTFGRLPILLPPPDQQKAIAHILGTFDDKIELNRKMNGTLEAMARAIFKSWFVDFDPVRAKADGRQPTGMDAATAGLFPASFENSEAGPIPKGWRFGTLSELADIKHGYAFKGQHFADRPTDDVLITPGNFAIGGGFQTKKLKYYEGPVDRKYVLRPGDLVVTMTDLSKQGDTLGYSAIVPAGLPFRLLHNQRIGLVAARAPNDQHFLHWLMRTQAYRHNILGSASGSTVRHTSPKRILAFRFPIPELSIRKEYSRLVGSFQASLGANNAESGVLGSLRDTLLPQLLSGELLAPTGYEASRQ